MKRKHFLFTAALLMAVSLVSCKKDDKNSDDKNPGSGPMVKGLVTYTINGGSFNHQAITINSESKAIENGAFSGNSGYLKINLDDAPADNTTNPKWGLDIAFNHVGTGTAKVNDPITKNTTHVDTRVYFLLQVQEKGKNKYLMSSSTAPAQTPGTINITKFESVGGTVEGNFEGTLIDGNVTYTITGGHFVAYRKS